MKIAEFGVMAFPDDGSVPYDHSPHQRIRADFSPPELRKLQSPPKMSQVRSCERSCCHTD